MLVRVRGVGRGPTWILGWHNLLPGLGRVRFMEIEINKVGGIMNELFRKCPGASGTTTWSSRDSC